MCAYLPVLHVGLVEHADMHTQVPPLFYLLEPRSGRNVR